MSEQYCKSACQECNGRISLPVDAVGVEFNCPHCGVNLQLVLKHYCEHCNGPLSFDGNSDAIGMEIQCGHCQNQTVLQPSALVIADEAPAGGTFAFHAHDAKQLAVPHDERLRARGCTCARRRLSASATRRM